MGEQFLTIPWYVEGFSELGRLQTNNEVGPESRHRHCIPSPPAQAMIGVLLAVLAIRFHQLQWSIDGWHLQQGSNCTHDSTQGAPIKGKESDRHIPSKEDSCSGYGFQFFIFLFLPIEGFLTSQLWVTTKLEWFSLRGEEGCDEEAPFLPFLLLALSLLLMINTCHTPHTLQHLNHKCSSFTNPSLIHILIRRFKEEDQSIKMVLIGSNTQKAVTGKLKASIWLQKGSST